MTSFFCLRPNVNKNVVIASSVYHIPKIKNNISDINVMNQTRFNGLCFYVLLYMYKVKIGLDLMPYKQ